MKRSEIRDRVRQVDLIRAELIVVVGPATTRCCSSGFDTTLIDRFAEVFAGSFSSLPFERALANRNRDIRHPGERPRGESVASPGDPSGDSRGAHVDVHGAGCGGSSARTGRDGKRDQSNPYHCGSPDRQWPYEALADLSGFDVARFKRRGLSPTRRARSPDGAKRHPDLICRRACSPGFAALNPGYSWSATLIAPCRRRPDAPGR
jgi:hypothetical protein